MSVDSTVSYHKIGVSSRIHATFPLGYLTKILKVSVSNLAIHDIWKVAIIAIQKQDKPVNPVES